MCSLSARLGLSGWPAGFLRHKLLSFGYVSGHCKAELRCPWALVSVSFNCSWSGLTLNLLSRQDNYSSANSWLVSEVHPSRILCRYREAFTYSSFRPLQDRWWYHLLWGVHVERKTGVDFLFEKIEGMSSKASRLRKRKRTKSTWNDDMQ